MSQGLSSPEKVLTYSLLVNGSVYGSQSALSAYQFACALIERGHQLVSVFSIKMGFIMLLAWLCPRMMNLI